MFSPPSACLQLSLYAILPTSQNYMICSCLELRLVRFWRRQKNKHKSDQTAGKNINDHLTTLTVF